MAISMNFNEALDSTKIDNISFINWLSLGLCKKVQGAFSKTLKKKFLVPGTEIFNFLIIGYWVPKRYQKKLMVPYLDLKKKYLHQNL